MRRMKDRFIVYNVADRKPKEGTQVIVFCSIRTGFRVLHRIGDMWRDQTGNIAHVRSWPWWCSLTPVRRRFRAAFHREGFRAEA
jgi:hypothetical protein